MAGGTHPILLLQPEDSWQRRHYNAHQLVPEGSVFLMRFERLTAFLIDFLYTDGLVCEQHALGMEDYLAAHCNSDVPDR